MDITGQNLSLIPYTKEDKNILNQLIEKKSQEVVLANCLFNCLEEGNLSKNSYCGGHKIWFINCEKGGVIGVVVLQRIVTEHQSAELVLMFKQSDVCENEEIFTEILDLILNYAFEELNLARIEVQILDSNLKSKQSFQNYGFQEEGLLRSKYQIKDKRSDVFIMSILRFEWERLKH